MKIRLLLTLFILTTITVFSQQNVTVKGFLYAGSTTGVALHADIEDGQREQVSSGTIYKLDHSHEFTIMSESKLQLYLSAGVNIWMGETTSLNIDNIEHMYVDGKLDPDAVINIRVKGTADFKMKRIGENGYFSIQTESADIEVKSTSFYISTYKDSITRAECYTGKLIITDPISYQVTEVTAGQSASIYGTQDHKNSIIRLYKIESWNYKALTIRVGDSVVISRKFSELPLKMP